MSMTDPIADLLTRIRNAQNAGHASVTLPRSNVKLALVKLLKDEGFVEGYVEIEDNKQGKLKVFLKYDAGDNGVIRGLERISKPGRRKYVGKNEIPRVRNGLGVAVLTTSHGLLTDRQAREAGVGGEILCRVW
jgi:small subunit ribosomal protein S8